MQRRTDLLDDAPVIICIPARNEEAMLPGLFAAIGQLSIDCDALHVCLYLDDCADGSVELLSQIGPRRAQTVLAFPASNLRCSSMVYGR